jgi:hypothetical protein
LLGEKKHAKNEDKNLEELIENKKKILALNASPSLTINLENMLLKEAQWGSGPEMNKIYEALNKYHYHSELTDIALSIKHFYANQELKKTHTTLTAILATMTTHLCLFQLVYKKSKMNPMLYSSLGLNQNDEIKLKNASCLFLQISKEQLDDRVVISQQIYIRLEQFPDWKNVTFPLQKIIKIMEQDK